jgi:type II restriction enzyme
LGEVPKAEGVGKIFFVQNGMIKSKDEVLERWSKTDFVKAAQNIESKGWLLDVLMCVEKIKQEEFSLEDVYAFERVLKAKHPSNNNVMKAKIRQQLQFLRDKGVLDFVGRGQYRMRLKGGA